MRVLALCGLMFSGAVAVGACQQGTEAARPLPRCEWCGASEAPTGLTWQLDLAAPDEPGDRMVVSGVVYEADGRTPAKDILMYAYQTNAAGSYAKRGDEVGNARRHGHLRGWLRTDERGRYHISTIRPGAYPGRDVPQHIHMTVTPPGGVERWIEELNFDDDPLLTGAHLTHRDGCGGSGIVTPARDADGVWTANRNVILPAERCGAY